MRRALIGALGLVLLAGCGLPSPRGADAPAASSAPVTAVSRPAPVVIPPTEVFVPSIGARSALVATGLNPDGTAEVPPVDQPLQASYLDWADEMEGEYPLVVYGHVNGRVDGRSAPGVFARLNRVRAGDEVLVTRADGHVETYVIETVEKVDKDAFPTRRVYDIGPGKQIRLVTCDGTFDRAARSYTDNFIAYGRLRV
jgi:hypothetical protein